MKKRKIRKINDNNTMELISARFSYLVVLIVFLIFLLLTPTILAYDPIYPNDNPDPRNAGVILGEYNPLESVPAGNDRWKSERIQISNSGTFTHFLLKVCDTSINTASLGFAVYEGTSGYNDPVGNLIAYGSYDSFDFSDGAGWYAVPFTTIISGGDSFNVTAGQYYHLTWWTEEYSQIYVCRANNDDPYPPKWASDCDSGGIDPCYVDQPPGVGGEFWNFQYGSGSANYVAGLVSVEATGECDDDGDCNDGNSCTDDSCVGTECVNTNNVDSCDDGLFCNGVDTCLSGSCSHSGNPCFGGLQCNNECQETTDTCYNDIGDPCSGGSCDGAGTCVASSGLTISGTSGTWTHGGSVILSGSEFGVKNPAVPIMWDDGESAILNDPSAVVGSGSSAERADGIDSGWDAVAPDNTQHSRQSATDADYDMMQYRSSGFRGHNSPHSNSNTFLGGATSICVDLNLAIYKWTESNMPNVYYVELVGGGNPGWDWSSLTPTNGPRALFRGAGPNYNYFTGLIETPLASLGDEEWTHGDYDSLGYSTTYFRCDAGNPGVEYTNIWSCAGGQTLNRGGSVGVMTCVPQRGLSTMDCSDGIDIDYLYIHHYERWDDNFPTTAGSHANEKVINFEGCANNVGIYENGDVNNLNYKPHSNTVSEGYTTAGLQNMGDYPNQDACCWTAPNQGSWLAYEWILYDGGNSDVYKLSVNNVAYKDETAGADILHSDRRGVTIGGYFCYHNPYLDNDCMDESEKLGHPYSFRYYDDIYIDNTWSRVMLANNQDYNQATIIEPQIPSAWSGNSIIVTANLGALTGDTAYLFVFDADNNRNSVGYAVTLGQQTYHEADNNPQDGCIDMIELIAYIGRWKNNDGVDMISLIEAIGIWKGGGC